MPETKTFVSMKVTKSAKSSMTTEYKEPEYPYGLSIRLNKDSLAKLKYGADDFKIGGELEFSAKATVDNISKDANRRGRDDQSVGLQITDIKVTGMKGEKKTLKSAKKMSKGSMSYAPASAQALNPGKHTY